MKKSILSLCILIATMQVNAQLSVDAQGRVKVPLGISVGTYSLSDSIASLKLTNTVGGKVEHYNLSSILSYSRDAKYSKFAAVYGFSNWPHTFLPNVGSGVIDFAAGVAGVASNVGIGVYGGTGYALPSSWTTGLYAGYFSGAVKVVGTVTATSFVTSSDKRLKTEIQPLTDRATHNIFNLNPVSYYYLHDTTLISPDLSDENIRFQHYGLLAQEVQKLYPNLVYTNQEGYMSINYTELIPLLIAEVQMLNTRVEELEQSSDNSKHMVAIKKQELETVAVLYQNNPNPFDKQTEIRYSLPQSTERATIYIYNMNGAQIASYELKPQSNILIIDGTTLQAGMYLYSLIADNEVIDTKRMILTK